MSQVETLAPAVAPGALAVIMHPIETQSASIATVLGALGFKIHLISSPQEFAQCTPPLGSLWVLFDQGELTVKCCAHLNTRQQRVFWGLIVLGQSGEVERNAIMQAGAEAYLSYPFSRDELLNLARNTTAQRTPVSSWGVLPAQLATAVDKAWMKLDQADYYSILELTSEASKSELEQRFHQRSLLLHPDRHRVLKVPYPQVYDKVNELYKRLLEAYRVLSDPKKRLLYDMMRTRGILRWQEQIARELTQAVSQSSTEQGRRALMEAERLRSLGQWRDAWACVQHALSLEPTSASLLELNECYAHVLKLIDRAQPQHGGFS